MKRFLLLALTAALLSPITVKAEKWKTVYVWPESSFVPEGRTFQIDLESVFSQSGYTYSKGKVREDNEIETIKAECSRARLMTSADDLSPPPTWLIRKKDHWYYDEVQSKEYPYLPGEKAFTSNSGIPRYDFYDNQFFKENDAILAVMCR